MSLEYRYKADHPVFQFLIRHIELYEQAPFLLPETGQTLRRTVRVVRKLEKPENFADGARWATVRNTDMRTPPQETVRFVHGLLRGSS